MKRKVHLIYQCDCATTVLFRGMTASTIVSNEDLPLATKASLSLKPGTRRVMACLWAPGPKRRKTHSLHRLIASAVGLSVPTGSTVDHANGWVFDNRRANLRALSLTDNLHNKGISKRNRSGIKGVSWDAGSRKWRASIISRGQRRYLGLFQSKEDAGRARRAAETELQPFSPVAGWGK